MLKREHALNLFTATSTGGTSTVRLSANANVLRMSSLSYRFILDLVYIS